MEELFSGCLGIIGQIFFKLLMRVVAGPILCVLASPVVVVRAFFGPGTYFQNIKSDYRRICLGAFFNNDSSSSSLD